VRVAGSGNWTRLQTVRMRAIPVMTLDGSTATTLAWSKGLPTTHELTVLSRGPGRNSLLVPLGRFRARAF
jgi:hypothetical protein